MITKRVRAVGGVAKEASHSADIRRKAFHGDFR